MKKIIVVLLAAALIGAAFAGCKAKPEEGSTSVPASGVTQTSEATTKAVESESTGAVTDAAATEATTADNTPAFIKEGCWYFYEEEDKMAYAFLFGNDGKADIAFFNRDNVEGDDAKYFEGDATYTIDGSTLTVSNIPSAVGMSSFALTIDGSSLLYNGIKLEKQDKLSLDYPFEHFNS